MFIHLYFGSIVEVPFENILKSVQLRVVGVGVTPYTLVRLPEGTFLYISVSESPLNPAQVKMVNRILNSAAQCLFEIDDMYEEKSPNHRYFLCFNTKIQHPGRNGKTDQVIDHVWQALAAVDADFDNTFCYGYWLFELRSKNALSVSVREELKKAIRDQYDDPNNDPNNDPVIFEFPSLD